MFDREMPLPAIGVDPIKPIIYARKQFNMSPILDEIVAADRDLLGACLTQHKVEIGENYVTVTVPSEGCGLRPELLGLHSQLWKEVVLLHVARSQCAVEVVGDCDFKVLTSHGASAAVGRPDLVPATRWSWGIVIA